MLFCKPTLTLLRAIISLLEQDKPDLTLLKDRHDYIQPKVAGHSASEQV